MSWLFFVCTVQLDRQSLDYLMMVFRW
jgi:hypothetical protein